MSRDAAPLGHSPSTTPSVPGPPAAQRHALVIGAGLAGAAVVSVLVRRGWQVDLLDVADGPAAAASGLPIGMLSPHQTRSPTPLSELSAIGVAAMRAELLRCLAPGAGWQPCEVDNRLHDLGRWPAALVRPGALVRAWLDEATALGRLRCHWNAPVARLQGPGAPTEPAHTGESPQRRAASTDGQGPADPRGEPENTAQGNWQALDAKGNCLAQAPVVVVCAALGSLDLLGGAGLPLRPVRGQLSFAAQNGAALAERPQRNNGVFVPDYQDSGLAPQWPSRIWSIGATYSRGDSGTELRSADHQQNAERLRSLSPRAAEQMLAQQACGQLLGWAQVRCASLDRLPLIGPLPDLAAMAVHWQAAGHRRARLGLGDVPRRAGLFTLCALGSRGITLALIGAQCLADQIEGQAPILPPALQQALDPARFAWREARRQSPPRAAQTASPVATPSNASNASAASAATEASDH